MTLPRWRSSKLWIAPIVGALIAMLLGGASLFADARIDWNGGAPTPLFDGSAGTARTLLSVIAGATTTLLALVFTILAVIIQLGSSQYSPRVLRIIFQDFPSHFTIGVFVATITYALLVLLAFGPDDGQIPAVSVTLGFGMAVLAIVTFAIYANHIAHSVRISSIINRIASETRRLIERECQEPVGEEEPREAELGAASHRISSSRWGIVVDIEEDELVEQGVRWDAVIVLTAGIGEQVHEGATLIEVHGNGRGDLSRLRRHVKLGDERQLERDIGWGFRILADIATRAVSTGINDATTATQALDRIHALLRVLARRRLPAGRRSDASGRTRLVVPAPDWEHFVSLATDEIRRDGASSIQVVRRLRELLVDVLAVAPEERRPPLARRLRLLEANIQATMATEHDRALTERVGRAREKDGDVTDRRAGGGAGADPRSRSA